MASANIHDYIAPGRRAHLVGIGGVSMSPLAEVLHKAGMVITGSDMRNSATVEHLRALGIPVAIGHRGENVQGAELVIRTAAVHDENPEIAAARAAGIPVFERAQAWGAIMRGYKNALCIAGTHGKTTTTSMCTHIIMAARMDPTVMIGGTLPLLGSGYRVGHGDTIILESCEYCNSFLSFFPTVAVILNIEADHLDFFKDLDDVEHSFRAFADRVPESGVIVANADDANTMHTLEGEERPVLTFGLEQGDVRAANLAWNRGLPSFDVVYRGDVFTHVALRVPGEHNVKNALAAAAAAIALAVEPEAVSEGLAAFRGAITQIPPMYSALKRDGKKLYELARAGKEVERAPRPVTIHALEVVEQTGPNCYTLRVRCSKGTYVRTLCHDIGAALGCGGCMSALRRTEAAGFSLAEAVPLEALLDAPDPAALLRPVDAYFFRYPAVTVEGTALRKAKNGNPFPCSAADGDWRVYGPGGEFLLLGRCAGGMMSTIKSFFEV